MHSLSRKWGLSWSHGPLFYIVMICLHLACAAEPVSLFPSNIMRIYQHCVKVIGRGWYCCLLPDLIALVHCICNNVTH